MMCSKAFIVRSSAFYTSLLEIFFFGTMTIAQVNTILVGASKMVAMTAACVGGVSVRALL